MELVDSFSRKFRYLRLSITDACNFRCVYCLPQGYNKSNAFGHELSLDEILRLARAFSEFGIEKIRLTGGEPCLRKDLVQIVEGLRGIKGIKKIALSTNAYNLKRLAPSLKKAGLDAVNISLDSLNSRSFEEITQTKTHASVLEGVEGAIEAGIASVKLNCVLLAGWNDNEFQKILDFVRVRNISYRFIELMLTDSSKEIFRHRHRGLDEIYKKFIESGWLPVKRDLSDGPAQEFSHKDYLGRVGFIAPYRKDFCETCNRLRVSAKGALQLCLFGEGQTSLRPFLQSDKDRQVLKGAVLESLRLKPLAHDLHDNNFGDTRSLSQIGG